MSILQYPETATTQLQVWNNAAFDAEEQPRGFSFPTKASWSSLHSSESLPSSDCSKENLSPAALNSTTPVPSRPLRSTAKKKTKGFGDDREDEKKIDYEIQEIENEIKRLSSRLEALRLQKAAAAAAAEKAAERRGRIVPAKFMEQKQSSAVKVIEEATPKAKVGVMRRGVSLGPAEISAGGGRFSRWPGKATAFNGMTPVPATQSRRKSCFWKLEDVDEMKGGVSERKKTLSLSPKSKRNVRRVESVQGVKQAAATVAVVSRKSVKKEDAVVALVQPRKLFKEGEKSVPSKKPAKVGRVVASRYNLSAGGGNNNNSVADAADARKRSLPENDKDDEGGDGGKRWDKRRSSLRRNGQGSEVRVKKKWEIPAQVVLCKKSEEEGEKKPLVLLPPPSTADMSDVLLPKIRTLRYPNESPRDSGAAKRVSDLTGKRSYFCPDEDMEEASVCQALTFAEDAADE